MIAAEVCGYCPARARRVMMRCADSAMFSHDPPKGVYNGMTPWANNQSTNEGVRWPARLSMTNRRRNGGRLSGTLQQHRQLGGRQVNATFRRLRGRELFDFAPLAARM